jgi:hypothetical protein
MDFVQLVTGRSFSCGMTPDQTVFCWGSIKGYIPGLYEQITAAGSGNVGCGVMTNGQINCWGKIFAVYSFVRFCVDHSLLNFIGRIRARYR